MKKLFLVLFVFVLFLGCKSIPEETAPAEPEAPVTVEEPAPAPEPVPVVAASTHYNQGREHYTRYEFDQAIAEYNQAIEKDPKMADAYIAKGNVYSGKLKLEEALDEYTTGAERNSDYDHYAQGYLKFLYEDYNTAVSEFTQAIEQKSNLLAAYNDRGLAYTNLKKYDLALADFNKAIEIDPNSAFAYNNRGNVYVLKRNYDKAIEDYNKASAIYPDLVFAHSGKAFANQQKKDYGKAIEEYSRAIELEPENATLYTLRGNSYKALKQNDLAEADYAKAEELKK